MKHLYIVLLAGVFLLCNTSPSFAQWQRKLPKRSPDQSHTLKDVSKAFEEYWAPLNVQKGFYLENGVEKKASGWKQFKRAEYFWEQRVDPRTGEFPTTSSVIEFEKSPFHLNKSAGVTSTASWTNIGTSSSTGGYAGIGRINCIAFHPGDANTYWVGSPSGGLWKTTDNGSTWSILNNSMSILGVSDIAVPSDYVTSNTLYIATGDRDAGSLWSLGTDDVADNPSIGVYKSVNGGATWTATGLTFLTTAGKTMGRLLIASDNTTLFASTSDGIYRSTNSGTSWTHVLTTSHPAVYGGLFMIDMEFKPGDENTIYASAKSWWTGPRIYRSTDGGTNWTTVFEGVAESDERIELAVTPADPTVVYAVMCYSNSGDPLKAILKSTNSGATFSTVWDGTVSGQNLLGYSAAASDMTAGQGTYDLCIAASPTDANTVFVGGVNTWYSTNGGASWTLKTIWSGAGAQVVHADKHCLAFQSGSVLFECNDGGIYRAALANSNWSDAGSNFVDKTNGIVISQIYRLGVSKTDVAKTLTGLQDNGSKLLNSPTWKDATGGDGMECIIDHTDPSYMYTTYVQGTIYRNTNGFSTTAKTTISNNISPVPTGAWVTPYIMDPSNSSILFAGYDKVWKTADRGNTWTAISGALSPASKLRSLAIARSNADVMYAADLANLWKTTNATTGTPPAAWSSITGTLPVGSASLTYVAVKADDPSTVWATFGGYSSGNKVFQSTDGGASWTNISGSLPNVPVLCIAQNTRSASTQLFIGTDAGVYAKDGNNDWILFNDGMPIVVVTELEFYYGAAQANDRLRAATFGRGLWETPVQALLPVELTKFTAIPRANKVQLDWTTATERNNYGFEVQRSTGDELWSKAAFIAGHGSVNAPHFYSFTDTPIGSPAYKYRLKQIDADGTFKYSDVVEVTMTNPSNFVVHQNFPNPFNPSTTIRYDLPTPEHVTIKLFDSNGRELATLASRQEAAGYHEIPFDGAHYASGVYYYSIQAGDFLKTMKMMLVK